MDFRFIDVVLLNILRRGPPVTALLLALTTVLPTLPADDDAIEAEATEALRELGSTTGEAELRRFLDNHGEGFVRVGDTVVYANHHDWTARLVPEHRTSHAERTRRHLSRLKRRGNAEDWLAQISRQSDRSGTKRWRALRLAHIHESSSRIPTTEIPFSPGKRLWTRQIERRTQARLFGRSVALIEPRSGGALLRLLSAAEGLETHRSAIGFRPDQVAVIEGHLCLLGRDQALLVDSRHRHWKLRLPDGAQLAGWPRRLGDLVVAPIMSGDSPCEFSIARWRLGQADLEKQWPLFVRHDRKGRLRGQLWLTSPFDPDHVLYLTHCGGFVALDSVNGEPRRWLPYTSLEIDRILSGRTRTWSRHVRPGTWTVHAQDSSTPLTVDLTDLRVTASPGSQPRALKFGPNGFVALDRHETEGTWDIGNGLALNRNGNHLSLVDRHREDGSPDNLARSGTPPAGHPLSRHRRLEELIRSNSPEDIAELATHVRDPVASPGRWLPRLWKTAGPELKAGLWSRWLATRSSEPFPFHDRWRLPSRAAWLWLSRDMAELTPPHGRDVSSKWSVAGVLTTSGLQVSTAGSMISVQLDGKVVGLDPTTWAPTTVGGARTQNEPRIDKLRILDRAAGDSRRVSADCSTTLTAALHRRGWATRLRIIDRDNLVWTADCLLGPDARIRCHGDGVLVTDPASGRIYVVGPTGRTELTLPLVERGPHIPVADGRHLHVVSPGTLITLHRADRARAIRLAAAGTPPPWFAWLWDQPVRESDWAPVKDLRLRARLIEGWKLWHAVGSTPVLRVPRSRLPLRADGILDDPYDTDLAIEWPGWPGASVMALRSDQGLLVAVELPDRTWNALKRRGDDWIGDFLQLAWDPLRDARWWPEADDRSFLVGPVDPNDPGPLQIRALKQGERPIGATLGTTYDPERRRHIYEILLTWEALGHRLPVRMNVAGQDDTGDNRIHRSLRPGMTRDDFVPRYMFEVRNAD